MNKRVLMCPPDYFEIAYEINPWMSKSNQIDRAKAKRQWENLRRVYQKLGLEVLTVAPVKGLPDMVFTANAGSVFGRKFILSRFKYQARRGEEKYFEGYFRALKYEVVKLPPDMIFEGVGDSLPWNDKLFGGYGFRSTRSAQAVVAAAAGLQLVPLKLIDPRFYHLDTAICPIDAKTVIYFPGAFDAASRRRLKAVVPSLVAVSLRDAAAFGCNAVAVNKKVVLSARAKDLGKKLSALGYEPILVDVSEFQKSGGSVRCLTLELQS